jgi:hypothetical protein
VLPPDLVDRLAGDRHPAARFTRDLDHALRVRIGSALVPSSAVTSGGAGQASRGVPAAVGGHRFGRNERE